LQQRDSMPTERVFLSHKKVVGIRQNDEALGLG
jgi:hypothetical protein